MSAVADKLREARARVERGWCQDDFSYGVNVCATGAIHAVINGDPRKCSEDCYEAEIALANAVPQGAWSSMGVAGAILSDWNDAPDRTQAEVLAAFDKAIELAEAE